MNPPPRIIDSPHGADSPHVADGLLVELERLDWRRPGLAATAEDIAAWYSLKAAMLEHVAATDRDRAATTRAQAELARRRAQAAARHTIRRPPDSPPPRDVHRNRVTH